MCTIIDDPETEKLIDSTRTLVFCFYKQFWSRSCKDVDITDIKEIIGKPYWFDRLIYLYRTSENRTVEHIGAFSILNSIVRDDPNLLLKSCIDRPEEWILLVLNFLNSLPNTNNVTRN